MSFISWQYALFLPVIVGLYWLLPVRRRLFLLLAGGFSLAPAAWLLGCFLGLPGSHVPLSLLGISGGLGLAFFGAHEALGLTPADRRPKYYLMLSVVFCLAILGFFKYFNFFTESFQSLVGTIGFKPDMPLLKIILPVGISFYTFQSLGYVIDIYRGQGAACSDFLTFATFDAFFPQMVSGPIERGKNLLPQLAQGASFRNAHLQDGLRLMLVGFFKKVFVADNCAMLANYAFDPGTSLNGYWAVIGVLAFTFQIYADFSGYTDIARGSAKLLGIDLMENFRFPYTARTPSEFWGRWHIFFISPWAAIAATAGKPCGTWPSSCSWWGCGTGRAGSLSCGGRIMALCWSSTGWRRPSRASGEKMGPGPGRTFWRCR
ncbi:MAG: hypothetical protein P8168_09860 [Deltaproteobacteria bacterium]